MWAYTARRLYALSVVYLYWMLKFLKNNHGIDLERLFWPLVLIYLMADVGSAAVDFPRG